MDKQSVSEHLPYPKRSGETERATPNEKKIKMKRVLLELCRAVCGNGESSFVSTSSTPTLIIFEARVRYHVFRHIVIELTSNLRHSDGLHDAIVRRTPLAFDLIEV